LKKKIGKNHQQSPSTLTFEEHYIYISVSSAKAQWKMHATHTAVKGVLEPPEPAPSMLNM